MTDNVLEQAVKGWARTAPARTTELSSDKASFGHFWQRSGELLARLPAKPKRNADEHAAAAEILALARESRARFMRAHAREVYDALTAKRSLFVRVDELCARAAREFPGLAPDARALERESGVAQRDKKGLEKAQGRFLAAVLADRPTGEHLCHSMLLPREDSAHDLAQFEAQGELELAGARLTRQGKAAMLTMRNPRYLNAEDETTLDGLEIALDVALLDRKTELVVLRGDTVDAHQARGQARVRRGHQPHAPLPGQDPLSSGTSSATSAWSTSSTAALALPGVHPEADSHREALRRGGGALRHRRALPAPAHP